MHLLSLSMGYKFCDCWAWDISFVTAEHGVLVSWLLSMGYEFRDCWAWGMSFVTAEHGVLVSWLLSMGYEFRDCWAWGMSFVTVEHGVWVSWLLSMGYEFRDCVSFHLLSPSFPFLLFTSVVTLSAVCFVLHDFRIYRVRQHLLPLTDMEGVEDSDDDSLEGQHYIFDVRPYSVPGMTCVYR